MKTAGKINLENYIIFEKLRSKNENGGGLAIGCIPELKPCWVRESQEPVEALSIDIFVKNLKIICCVGYGRQENDAILSIRRQQKNDCNLAFLNAKPWLLEI